MRISVLVLTLLLALGGYASTASGQPASDSTYTVQSGDTLFRIAKNVGVSVRTLMRWNNLDDTELRVGQTLRVRPPRPTSDTTSRPPAEPPTPAEPGGEEENSTTQTDTSAERSAFGRYRVQSGDTFISLALQLGTTADSLFALNDSTTGPLSPGQVIRVPRRFGPPTHVVEQGETLYTIAGQYGVSVRALKAKNDLESDTLTPGQALRVPRRTASDDRSESDWADPDTTARVAVYPETFRGRLTASGATYDPDDFVVSHPSLPFNSVLLLSSGDTSTATFARVLDRGPVEEGVLLDVSRAVAEALGIRDENTASVDLRVVWIAPNSP